MRIYVYSDCVTELQCKADQKKKSENIFYIIRGMFISVSSCSAILLVVPVRPLN